MEHYVAAAKGKAKLATLNALRALKPQASGQVVIKPNLVYDVKANGVTTDVSVIEGIVQYFHGKNDIVIAEGSCDCNTFELFDEFGYSKLADKYGIKLVDLNKDKFQKVKLYDKSLGVAKTVLNADYLVSAPVLKTHEYMTISVCVKNLMGCLERKLREKVTFDSTKEDIHLELSALQDVAEMSHEAGHRERVFFPKDRLSDYWSAQGKFEQRLVALYRALAPKLGVIDATVASEGNAPIHGIPVKMGLVLASENLIDADAVAAYLMGIDPNTIGYLKLAQKQGLGELSINKIGSNVDLSKLVHKFKLPPFIDYLYRNNLYKKSK